MQPARPTPSTHPIERFFAILSASFCLVLTILIWWSVSAQQPMWPLPALYLLEMLALSLLCAFSFFNADPLIKFLTWGAVGIFIAFSILGAFSVGFFYLPIAIISTVISITWDIRNKQPIVAHLGVCLIAGMAQAAWMLAVIRLR
jgi:FtsH-binding integral membrane protein